MGTLMSQKEVRRAQVLDMLEAGKISQQAASLQMGISTRQVRRLSKRYRAEGLAGLVSKQRGTVSNRRLDAPLRATVIKLIGTRYRDFGPTLANEKLAELHGIHLSVESARQMMIAEGFWKVKKGSTVCAHPMRERRARFGELIQIDGSPHDGFEGRADRCTLLVFIDDATGRLTRLRFTLTETTLGYMRVLHDHIQSHGTPAALYSDKHSIFRINAKDAANAWLPSYIEDYNRRFAVEPKDQADAHLAYLGTQTELARILSAQVTRTLSKNLSCQYENPLLQVVTTGTGLALRGAKVTVHEHVDGQKELIWRKRKLVYSVMSKQQRQGAVADSKTLNERVDKAMVRRSTGHKPAPNNPWRNMPIGKSAIDGQRAAL